MAANILVVDDEKDIADLLEVYLKNENYLVYKHYSAKAAIECIEENDIDLAILDVMLPDMNGFELCRRIRETYTYPIIMLTAKDEETDKITGLTLGADDYITKPFRPLEMLARVKAQLRRYKRYNTVNPEAGQSVPGKILSHKELLLNTTTHECFLEGEKVSLTPTEFTILRVLLERKGPSVSYRRNWTGTCYSERDYKPAWRED